MNTKTIIIELCIPIYNTNNIIIQPKYISLYTTYTNNTSYYNFTAFADYQISDLYYLIIQISDNDIYNIQQTMRLYTKQTLYLYIQTQAFIDIYNNNYHFSHDTNIPCILFIHDAKAPELLSYNTDLNLGIITLTFSKPILLYTLQLKYIYLTNNYVYYTNNSIISLKNASIIYPTTTTSTASTYVDTTTYTSSIVNININTNTGYPNTRDSIYLTNTIATNRNTLYLYTSIDIAIDTSIPPNYLIYIPHTSPLQVTTLILDASAPSLLSFHIDLTLLLLTVVYNKAVDAYTNIPAMYILVSDPTDPASIQYSLSNSYTILPTHTNSNTTSPTTSPTILNTGTSTTSLGDTVVISISPIDLDNIMSYTPNLCTHKYNCYLRINYGVVRDTSTNHNYAQSINRLLSLPPTTFIPDLTPVSVLLS